MKASELRIGNHIQDNDDNLIIIDRELMHYIDCCGEDESGYESIQLTEEWLLKFEFEKIEQGFVNQICLYSGNDCFNYNVSFFEHHNLITIKYVHQLQNLYFALTGEELKII